MLCGAIPRSLHDAVTMELAKHGATAEFTTFASLCVHAAAVWRESGWWCIKCPESFILAVAQGRTLALLRTLPTLAGEQENEALARMAAEAARAALRDGIAAPRTIHYVDLSGQTPTHTQAFGAVDFRARPLSPAPRVDSAIKQDVALAACLEAHR